MSKRSSALLALLAASFIGSGAAAEFAYPVANETGSAYRGAEYILQGGKLVRVDEAAAAAPVYGAFPADSDWEYVGGDSGWKLKQHEYGFSKGGVIHADAFRHETPRPKIAGDSPDPFSAALYAGG